MITAKRLREVLRYDADSGIFTWNISMTPSVRSGYVAGSVSKSGYLRIKVDRREYRAHRLAWLYMYGEFPSDEIDHVDRNKLNNRIANLREATRAQNQSNNVAQSNSKTGRRGVTWNEVAKKFQVQIQVNGRRKYMGLYSSIEEAESAYSREAKKLFGVFFCDARAA